MKKIISLYIFALLFVCSAFLPSDPPPSQQVLQQLERAFHQNISTVEQEIAQVTVLAEALAEAPATVDALQKAHLDTRLAFKRIEYLLEYFDHYSIKKNINGAPLPTVEPKVPELIVVEPSGLQVLDELIFSEDPLAEKEEIIRLAQKLQGDFKKVAEYQQHIRITHRHVFEAVRQELLRVFTLGLTGFDTPGSVNAIPEATASWEAMATTVEAYYGLAEGEDAIFTQGLIALFSRGQRYLEEHPDFDDFDRLTFLKDYVDPLYDKLYQLQKKLRIETLRETNPRRQPVNESAHSLFAADFLNPAYFANIDLSQDVVDKRTALGKILFFDPVLSSNLQGSCASCHQPDRAFTDGVAQSPSLSGTGHVKRNAPTVVNAVFAERYFYDLREPQLERQIKHVVMDSLEFATDFATIIDKLNQSDTYRELFAEAYADFPSYQLSKWSISDALACYVSSLTSFNSPVDQYIRGEREELEASVKRGFNLFMGKAACGTCHFAPTFNGTVPPGYDESESEVLGVPATKDTLQTVLDGDIGRFNSFRPIDQAPFYVASFKTVTVRNIAETAPYMHNGVYDTLEEVVDFYNRGGGVGLGLEVPYQTLPDTPLGLTQQEQQDLVAFMKALSDETYDRSPPEGLPRFEQHPEWNDRPIGGTY
ncbi:MAG: cytochrome c peroxidase [Bacteroidota bacterium]